MITASFVKLRELLWIEIHIPKLGDKVPGLADKNNLFRKENLINMENLMRPLPKIGLFIMSMSPKTTFLTKKLNNLAFKSKLREKKLIEISLSLFLK